MDINISTAVKIIDTLLAQARSKDEAFDELDDSIMDWLFEFKQRGWLCVYSERIDEILTTYNYQDPETRQWLKEALSFLD